MRSRSRHSRPSCSSEPSSQFWTSSILLILLVFGCCLEAQRLNHAERPGYDLRVPVDLVLVPVTVEDRDGRLVSGLQQNDFAVSEEGTVQKLSYFSADPAPLSVAFLLDRTVDDRSQEIFKSNMQSLVEAFSSFDEMAFYEFLDSAHQMQNFTHNKELLLKPVARIEFVPIRVAGLSKNMPRLNTSFLDNAIMTAAYDLTRRAQDRRKVILVASNGVVSPSERRNYPQTRKYLIQNDILVYGIGLGNSTLFRKVDPLKKYAEPTGGEVLYPWKTRAFAETYQKISQAARNQYVLGYVPQNLVQPETYRSIEVRVLREGWECKVRHRKGYFASANP
jgi:VWFA-related protein